jgi:uncharacterized protein YodC (DUF2158 family)
MSEHQWRPGDIVGVKSGGSPVTVAKVELGKVFCEWFEEKPMSREAAAFVLMPEAPPGSPHSQPFLSWAVARAAILTTRPSARCRRCRHQLL